MLLLYFTGKDKDQDYVSNFGAMPTNNTCIGQLLYYAKVKEAERDANDDKDISINNYCHNGSKCRRWISDMLLLYFNTGKRFDKDSE